MEAYWIWWFATVVLIIAEMFSGTFYLLAVAIGLVAAGLAAFMGLAWSGQVVTAAALCCISVVTIYRWRKKQAKPAQQSHLAYDIGQSVQIASWTDARHARVSYRGAEWEAELASVAVCDSAKTTWHIKEMAGSILIIE
jgi:membrane protein implicated in regulation of membrane protease activity